MHTDACASIYTANTHICREKIRKKKTQKKIIVKDNKKCFYKYISSKRRTKENLYPSLDVAGNITTEDDEMAEVLSVFLCF